MAAVAYDSLEYANQLESAGMPRAQAEIVAKGLTTMFIHNFDALVTKDYLETRFSEFETRINAKTDKRFAESDARMEKRFAESDAKMDAGFSRLDLELAGIKGQFKLVYWMLAVIIASTVIPAIQGVYSSL